MHFWSKNLYISLEWDKKKVTPNDFQTRIDKSFGRCRKSKHKTKNWTHQNDDASNDHDHATNSVVMAHIDVHQM